MNKGKNVTIRMPKTDIEYLKKRGSFTGPTVLEDLHSYWAILTIGMRGLRKKFNRSEVELILDVQNGAYFAHDNFETWIGGGLVHQVEDGIALDGLDDKWSVDGAALIKKINDMDAVEIIALLDWCKVWWHNCDDEKFIDRELKRFLSLAGNPKK